MARSSTSIMARVFAGRRRPLRGRSCLRASIGTSVYLDHATGIVIGAFVTIGDEVTILQNVTIGRMTEALDRAPRIGRGAYLGGGATILGDISIGDFARVGAGSVVTSNVPGGCTAVGVPARLANCPEGASA